MLDPDLIERFKADLQRIWPQYLPPDGKLALAVSGGPDSMAMLMLAHASIPDRIVAATVDHGLREEAAREAQLVADICAERGIRHSTLPVNVNDGNLQEEARIARYAALAGWCDEEGATALATAHHADDQAETFLMRANRASGLAGLAGIRAVGWMPGSELPLLRPLLNWRREDLAGVVADANISPAIDPSNTDERFDRVKMRQNLSDADWLDTLAIARSAANLADAGEALDALVDETWSENVTCGEGTISFSPPELRYLRYACTARAVEALGSPGRGEAIAQLVDGLEQGRAGNVGGVYARARRGRWEFTPEPPRRN